MSDKPLRSWAMWLLAGLMVIALGVSLMMTQHHELQLYGGEEAGQLWGCEAGDKVNCDIVNTSEWSELFGVPLFTWAIPTYLLVLACALSSRAGNAATFQFWLEWVWAQAYFRGFCITSRWLKSGMYACGVSGCTASTQRS